MVFMYWTKFRAVKVRFFSIGIIICFLIMYSGIAYSHDLESNVIEGENKDGESKSFQLEDFILSSPEGALSLKDLRGSVVLLFLGFTSCADVCQISLATISHAFYKLSEHPYSGSDSH